MRERLFALGFVAILSGLSCPGSARAGTEDGSCLESWELLNLQQKSVTYQQLVKSSSYQDLPTVVMLLSSG